MNKVPHITRKHYDEAFDYCVENASPTAVDICNKAIEIALTEQSTEQYITAEEARKLGAGKAEWQGDSGEWYECGERCSYNKTWGDLPLKYRAIKQPEPVEPHAELKAMYAQQVKDGTLDNFVWEYRDKYQVGAPWTMTIKPNFTASEYRCTHKATCQVKNLDTGELKAMTREAAKLLQVETRDTCDWFYPNCVTYAAVKPRLGFTCEGIYTYKRKEPKVHLTVEGEQPKEVTQAEAQAIWERLKPTHEIYYRHSQLLWDKLVGNIFSLPANRNLKYELRENPAVKLTIDDEPAKMLTPAQCEAERLARVDTHDLQFLYKNSTGIYSYVVFMSPVFGRKNWVMNTA